MLKLRGLLNFERKIGSIRFSSSHNNMDYREVKIPVPWGHIAGKWWGPQDKRPILTLHGWQDNCGSFDLLIPQLPKHIPYLAIDFPGHGYSSKYPGGIFYHGIDCSILIRTLQKYFKWPKVTLMGHSLGAICSYSFSFIYPEEVDFVVCIDGLHPLINPKRIERVQLSIEEFIKYDEQFRGNTEAPTYTMEEAIQRLHLGTRKSIDLDKCKYILERNIRPAKKPGMYYFDRDPRLKCGPLVTFSKDDLILAGSRTSFPIFVSIAEQTPFFSNDQFFKLVFEEIGKVSKDLDFHKVPGKHHMHLNNPEKLSPLICNFILKHDVGDRSIGEMPASIVHKL